MKLVYINKIFIGNFQETPNTTKSPVNLTMFINKPQRVIVKLNNYVK